MTLPIDEIKERLDIVKVISEYLRLKKVGANFKTLCPFHSEKNPSFYVSPARQIWHCFGCFLPGSLIKTEKGFHKIEDIQVGQRVLTHKGKFMSVVRTLWRPYRGEIIDIKARKSNEVTSLTADHEVYVIKTKHCKYKNRKTRICTFNCKKSCPAKFYQDYKIEKLSAGQLLKDDYLLYPVNQKIKDIEFIDLDKYCNRRISNFGPDIKEIPTKIKCDEKFLKLIGYYIAEGSNHRAYIRFSLGNHEERFAKEIKNLIREIFKIETSIHKREKGEKTGLEISACNSKLANIFENLCGKHAENKHIPFEFQYLSLKKQKIILDAVYKGDDYQGKVSKCKDYRRYKAITTTSLILAEQLRDILLRFKIAPTLYVQKKKIDKKGVHHKKAFTIKWQESYILNFSQIYENPREKTLYWLCPIKEIKKRHYKGDTFDLTVARDHSYVAGNFLVSNCGAGGDIFKFIMQIEGIEFKEALEILAKKAGVELKRESVERRTERQRIYDICELATKFFEKQLKETKTGQRAKEYLLSRKISEDSIKKWRLGYAPNTWQGLSDFLVSKGYKRDEIVKAGLAVGEKEKRPYDRFRGRIIFPIFNLQGQVIGFGGRIFKATIGEEKPAKYINTPNTLIYDKSKALYGLNRSKMKIREKDECILVEGYTDVILSHQGSVENIVSTSGTALTPYQLRVLSRYTKKIISAFDMDIAGEAATKKGIDNAQFLGFDIKIASLPEGKDPADIISQDSKKWQRIIDSAKEIVNFYFEQALSRFNKETVEGKKRISEILLPFITRIQNKIEHAHWVKEFAKELEIKEEAIWEEIKRISALQKEPIETEIPAEEEEVKPKSYQRLIEERLLMLLLKFPEEIKKVKKLPKFSFKEGQELFETFQKQQAPPKELGDFLSLLELQFEVEKERGETDIKKEIEFCISSLFKILKEEKLKELTKELKEAEIVGDNEKISRLLKKLEKLTKI